MAGRRKRFISLLAAAFVPVVAHGADFLSVAEPAVLYDGPSAKDKARFVIARDTPVEMVVTVGAWVKIRDSEGALAWIEKSSLTPKRTVMVRAERGQVRAAAVDTAPLVFEAERNVVLDLVEVGPPGWVSVKHRGGQSGFVKASQVWGL
jgi:SH3-like domain-containing protein